jgi:predicted phage baseplate assembly protein
MVSDTSVVATNYFPSTRGLAGESLEFAFVRARNELKVPLKAVSSTDFEYIAINTPGLRIARAKAYSPSFPENCVVVIVVPFSFQKLPMPSKGLLDTVLCHLDKHRLITTKVVIVGPKYVGINAYPSITVKSKSSPDKVKDGIVKALDNFFSPLSLAPEQNAWRFGRDVFQSEVIAIIEAVEGVDCVAELSLVGSGNLANFEPKGGDIIIKNYSLVYLHSCHVNFVLSSEGCKNMKNDEHRKREDIHRNG